jgi:hypothetical protein
LKTSLDAKAARAALSALPTVAAWETLDPPALESVYIPEQHPKALSLNVSVVVGMRGAGKSFWTAILADDARRASVAALIEQPALTSTAARVGFGLSERNDQFPTADVIASLLEKGVEPYRLWQTVVMRHASNVLGVAPSSETWEESVRWTMENAERADEKLTQYDDALAQRSQGLLVLFDALDRVSASNDWDIVRSLTKAALRLALRCRSRRSIRIKLFLRPDLEEDREIWNFPDSSKLRHDKVALSWTSTDLYGLVLSLLANSGEFGSYFRNFLSRRGVNWKQLASVYQVPRSLLSEEPKLRMIIESLADRYMGKDRKRGITFTWIPTHLADAAGRISPRSYLLAFKKAAEVTNARFPEHNLALHHLALMEGVSAASGIRVEEIAEDHPWMRPLLEAARGTVVPCDPTELTRRWTPECLSKVRAESTKKLPPRRFTTLRRDQVEALIDDLVELAVLYRTEDGRVNMPDIFRVGFGIKRMGGVKPPR